MCESFNNISSVLGHKTDLAVWEPVQESTVLNVLRLNDNIAVSTAGCGSYNILVERKGNKHDECHQVDHRAYCAHGLWAGIQSQ